MKYKIARASEHKPVLPANSEFAKLVYETGEKYDLIELDFIQELNALVEEVIADESYDAIGVILYGDDTIVIYDDYVE